ncbi:MAG: ABC transporter permease [Parachlamydiales bacterium]|nr:ABC transporter permease [Parachlamydiales bacterium]
MSINFENKSISYFQDAKIRFLQNRSANIGMILLFFIIFYAILGPIISNYIYSEIHLDLKNLAPCKNFWFGSDELGRDVFTRTAEGARISLAIGIIAALLDVIIGVIWGAVSSLLGGIIDEIMMRICDILATIPYLLWVILLMVVLESNFFTIILALSMRGWINMARIVRAKILTLKKMPFIEAAKISGAKNSRIIFRHLIPNCIGPILTTMTLSIPLAIFTEAFLSFLGLGLQAPIASWGTMVSDALSALRYYPWRLFFPAIMLSITMLGFNLIGDGLSDALDPRLKK